MKKLLLGLVGLLVLGSGVAFAESSFKYPSTFSLKVGESAYISNYQNMKINFVKVNPNGINCESTLTPCPLANPREGFRSVVINISTEGGCGPNADPRCLGAPAYSQSFTVSEGSSVNALALNIKVSNVLESSATFSVAVREDGGDGKGDEIHTLPPQPPVPGEEDGEDNITIKPLPPVVRGEVNVLPVGRDFNKLIICPNGDESENCSVCSNGECRPEPGSGGNAVSPGPSDSNRVTPPILRLKSDESFVSAVKVEADPEEGVAPAYEVKAKRRARLFFLFPVNAEITYTVTATGSTTVSSRPWWNFLAW